MNRQRRAKIIATLGPSSSDFATIRALFDAGADIFRLNFSHGTHQQHRARVDYIREIERERDRPIAILLDLQGPKLRVGTFADGPVELVAGQRFRLDLDPQPGNQHRAPLPHPEIFAALKAGTDLLLDDGKIRLSVQSCGADFAETVVVNGGRLSERKGVNVPSVLLPISALTPKDRADLDFGMTLDIDWVALSFVQRAADLHEVHDIVKGRVGVMSKLEKPAAIDSLAAIVEASDAVMVARGDLGVELPAERVPRIQKQIVRACRDAGKPVIVATQMLESMVAAPVPTRAEASDVATAVYDGADAVMLSAESASGNYPVEAVAMMSRIIAEVESDPHYRDLMEASQKKPQPTVADAVCLSMRATARVLPIAAIVTYTRSGATCLRAARERPQAAILSITPDLQVARRLALTWGVHSVFSDHAISDVPEMIETACAIARDETLASSGDHVVVAAGMPFGVVGSTNFLHIAKA
ncbi:pyruvate kinase [Piscinibacter sakaiensis]|uniref:pyruvate kinase n=1 Tax=Piscinibacter sakaiensis TaxID=1547922 RepID=UPI003AAA6F6A